MIRRAMATPYVGGVTIQPVFGSGRSAGIDPNERLTHTGVLARLGPQTDDEITWRDLTALPCSHPHCCSVGYFLKDDGGEWRSLVGLIGHERLKEFLDLNPDLLANRIADSNVQQGDPRRREEARCRPAERAVVALAPVDGDIWRDICVNCDLSIGTLATLAASSCPASTSGAAMLADRVLRVTIKPFMDVTHDRRRLTQCCVHVATVNRRDRRAPVRAVLRGAGVGAAGAARASRPRRAVRRRAVVSCRDGGDVSTADFSHLNPARRVGARSAAQRRAV
ncbi:MAG: hypothetical protein R2692_05570 [Microbacterium sp.]